MLKAKILLQLNVLKSKNYCTIVFDKKYHLKEDENDASLLHIVAAKGYYALFKILIEEFQDTNPKMNDGSTILHCAAEKGHFSICKLIIDGVQIINPSSGMPSEALIINSIQIMNTLEPSDCFGNTPLHKAAMNGHLSVVKLLIDNVQDKNPENDDKDTPFKMAARYEHWSVCLHIVGYIQDLNLEDDCKNTLLHMLATCDGNLALYQSIIDSVEDNRLDKNLFNLTSQIFRKLKSLYKNSHKNLCLLMNRYGIFETKNPEGKYGITLLHVAAKVGNLPLYQLIMDNTEDKNPKNNFGDTPFHMAAINGHLEVCQMLLDTYNVLGKELKIESLATLIDKIAHNGHFLLIQWINDNIKGNF